MTFILVVRKEPTCIMGRDSCSAQIDNFVESSNTQWLRQRTVINWIDARFVCVCLRVCASLSSWKTSFFLSSLSSSILFLYFFFFFIYTWLTFLFARFFPSIFSFFSFLLHFHFISSSLLSVHTSYSILFLLFSSSISLFSLYSRFCKNFCTASFNTFSIFSFSTTASYQ